MHKAVLWRHVKAVPGLLTRHICICESLSSTPGGHLFGMARGNRRLSPEEGPSLVCLKRKLWREDARQGVDATVCGDERGGQCNPSAQCRRHTDGPPRHTGAWARCERPPVRHRPLNTRQNSSEPPQSSNPGDPRNPESLLLPRGTHEGRHPQGYVPEGL